MNQNDNGLVKNFTSAGFIDQYRIVALTANEGEVAQGSDGATPFAGVTGVRGAVAAGDRIDVSMDAVREVVFGGVVAPGDYLTSDAQGRAIKAVPDADGNLETVGRSLVSATEGARGQIHVLPGRIQGEPAA